MSSTTAVLLGTAIGSLIGFIGTLISTLAMFKKETRLFRRNLSQKHVEEVGDTYSFFLNVIFNMKRGLKPDPNSYGDLYSRILLYGSSELKEFMKNLVSLPRPEISDKDVDSIIEAMQRHLKELNDNLK